MAMDPNITVPQNPSVPNAPETPGPAPTLNQADVDLIVAGFAAAMGDTGSELNKRFRNFLIGTFTGDPHIHTAFIAWLTEMHGVTAADFEPGGPFALWQQEVNTAYSGGKGAIHDSPEVHAILEKLGIPPPHEPPGA